MWLCDLNVFYFLPQVSLALNLPVCESTKLYVSCALCMCTDVPLGSRLARLHCSGEQRNSKLHLRPVRKKVSTRWTWTVINLLQIFSCKALSAFSFSLFFFSPPLAFAQHFEGLCPLIYLNVSVIGSLALYASGEPSTWCLKEHSCEESRVGLTLARSKGINLLLRTGTRL